jgi:uncharacterized protein YjiK
VLRIICIVASFTAFFSGSITGVRGQQKRASGMQNIPAIRGYDFADRKVPQFKLPNALREISGLAFTADGRLLCHGDERGVIYEIDYHTGKEQKQFSLGRITVLQDFEDIAVKEDTIFLVTSSGVLYRFHEGADGEKVSYRAFRTALDARYNVEGLVYDDSTDCLLLACKGYPGRGYDKHKAVYAFSLRTYKLHPAPRFLLPLKTILHQSNEKEFNPSGIARHPQTGNFFVIAANGSAIVEVTPKGEVIGFAELPKSVHRQPEAIAIAADGTLVIANEGSGKDGTIVIYEKQGAF